MNYKLIFLSLSLLGISAHAMESERRVKQIDGQLFAAIRKNDLDTIQHLLDSGANANSYTSEGAPALYVAAYYGNQSVIECLLNHGAKLDCINSFGTTALMKAAIEGHHGVVQYLLERGADADRVNENCDSALALAAKQNKQSCCELLVEAMIELTPEQKNSIYATLFCVKPIQGLDYPIAERLCEAFLCENKTLAIDEVYHIYNIPIKRHLLEKYSRN